MTRVGYAEMEDHGYVIRREYTRGVASLVGRGPSGAFGAALRDAYRRGETVVVNDVSSDPRFTEAERVGMHAKQIAAFIGTTLVKNGRFLAAFGANNATARAWTPTEIALVRDVAERTWDAVERTRAEASLREREQRLQLSLIAPRGVAQDSGERTPRVHASLPAVPVLRILIVDDHAPVREAYRGLLQARREFVVVGDASNRLEAIDQARALRPDVILMDISMPHMDGVEATRRLRAELPSIQILGLSSEPRTEPLHPIEEAGAAGYFVKSLDTQRLIDHMLGVHAGMARGLPGQPA